MRGATCWCRSRRGSSRWSAQARWRGWRTRPAPSHRPRPRNGVLRKTVTVDDAVLSGTPCVKGTRILAHDIAEMVANGDRTKVIVDAWPGLTLRQIDAAVCYALAYP